MRPLEWQKWQERAQADLMGARAEQGRTGVDRTGHADRALQGALHPW